MIDVFDRTEFIQMLGRVRIKSGRKINVYIHEYTNNELEKLLWYNITSLIVTLYIDLLDKKLKKDYYYTLMNE